MKFSKIIPTLSLGFCLTTLTSRADLISYWPLDETEGGTAEDVAGDNDAIWQNSDFGDPATTTNLAWVTEGKVGGAADLSDLQGGNNYFQMNLPELIGASSLTFAAWINNDANAGYNGIFMTRTFNGQTNNSWGLAIENGPNERFDARVDGSGIDSADGSLLVDGNWKHLVLTWDATSGDIKAYINGTEVATGSSSADDGVLDTIQGPDSGPWYIGYDDCCGGGRDLDGEIDEVAVWDQVLGSAEIGLLAAGVRPDELNSADLDGDGMPNDYENMFAFLDENDDADAEMDFDNDGLTNLDECTRGTKPDDDDTDDDNLKDGDEVNLHGTNPKVADTDEDGINDDEELVSGADGFVTNPLLPDTDMDGFGDGEEVTNGTDPTDPNDPAPAEPMMIGHWPMDEADGLIAADIVNGNNGTWQNADGSDLLWTQGQIGGAAQLTDGGLDGFFQIDTINQLISSNKLTITAWIEPDDNPGYNGIFMTRTIDGRTSNSWGLAFQNEANPNRLDARVQGVPAAAADDSLAPDGGWYHVAMVWDGAAATLTQYINGQESASNPAVLNRQILETSGPWYIGYDDCCGGNRDFSGLIDDIGMWNDALTATQIEKIYDDGLGGTGLGGQGTPFEITKIVVNADNSVTLAWNSNPAEGVQYTILHRDDLSAPISEWGDLTDDWPTGGESTTYTTDPGFADGVARKFFAIKLTPQQ